MKGDISVLITAFNDEILGQIAGEKLQLSSAGVSLHSLLLLKCWIVFPEYLSITFLLRVAIGCGHFLCTSPGISSPDSSHFWLPHSLLLLVHPEPLCCSCPCFYSLDFTFLINTDQFTALEFIMHHPFLLTSYQNFSSSWQRLIVPDQVWVQKSVAPCAAGVNSLTVPWPYKWLH